MKISRPEKQMTKVVTCGLRVNNDLIILKALMMYGTCVQANSPQTGFAL